MAGRKQSWIFPGVMKDGQRGTVKVIRNPREGLQFDSATGVVRVVTYYDATWRGDEGGIERFCLTPQSLDKMRNPPAAQEGGNV